MRLILDSAVAHPILGLNAPEVPINIMDVWTASFLIDASFPARSMAHATLDVIDCGIQDDCAAAKSTSRWAESALSATHIFRPMSIRLVSTIR